MKLIINIISESIVLLFLIPVCLSGQGTGLLLDDAAYNSITRQPVYDEGSKSENSVLKDYPVVDLKPWCPYPQAQGVISSCTGWASGYGAMSISYAVLKNWKDKRDTITQNAFSALFIYNQIKEGSCDAGSFIDKAGTFLKEKGDVSSKVYDKFKNKCDRQPTPEELKNAASFRIKDFMTLFASNSPDRVKIEKTKLSLVQKRPVVIGMLIRKNFDNIRKKDLCWYPDLGDTTFNGAHAMVVIGYDDGKEAFEIMNSWGTGWGNEGFAWVKYKDFARFCSYGLQFIFPDDLAANQIFTVKSKLRRPYYSASDTLLFADQNIYLNGGIYELEEESVERNYLLQVILEYATSGSYVYAFSYDAQKAVKVHWPRDGNLDAKFDAKNESAIITVPNIHLVIPNEYGALSFSDPGTEYICLLVANKPIENLNQYLKKLQQLPQGNFIKNLYTAFDKTLMPIRNIRYNTEFIGFNNAITNGSAVPIVLQIKVK